jgi:sensor histidine kinase regulating citrate/malate metabolism
MSEAVLAALVTGVLAVAAEVVIAVVNNKAMLKELERQTQLSDARIEQRQAVMSTKLENLTDEVRRHNEFAQRMPVLEEKIAVANHRISDLESEVKS